jgi:Icc-related predicted phosphoesterase
MQICFTSDLHGDPVLYDQLEELLRAQSPELLILGGDLLSDGDRHDPLGTQVLEVKRTFMPRIRTWRASSPGLTVACLPGNHEWSCTCDELRACDRAGELVLLETGRIWQHHNCRFLGYSSTPATPHWLKDLERLDLPGDPVPDFPGVVWDPVRRRVLEVDPAEHFRDDRSMERELSEMPTVPAPWILVAHAPPHHTNLDRLSTVTRPIGSRALRRFIELRQPAVSLHGHVHESPAASGSYTDRIGNTLAVNPGQSHDRLYAVLFDSERPADTMRHTVFR